MSDKQSHVRLPVELTNKLQERAEAAGYNDKSEYAEHVLRTVLAEQDPIEESPDEANVQSRLESLGYLDR